MHVRSSLLLHGILGLTLLLAGCGGGGSSDSGSGGGGGTGGIGDGGSIGGGSGGPGDNGSPGDSGGSGGDDGGSGGSGGSGGGDDDSDGGSGDDDGGSSEEPGTPTNASPGGIWEGQTSTGQLILGLATESGEFHFIADDGVQYFGTVTTSGNTASASYTGITAFGTVFRDGSSRGTGTLTGSIQQRASLTGTTAFTTEKGMVIPGTIALTYNPVYERDSSLATIAGNFRQDETNYVLSINSDGVAFLQDPDSGCTVNGTVSIIDAEYNAYRVEYTYQNCTGIDAVLNGLEFTGLATLYPVEDRELLILAASSTSGSTLLSAVMLFERM